LHLIILNPHTAFTPQQHPTFDGHQAARNNRIERRLSFENKVRNEKSYQFAPQQSSPQPTTLSARDCTQTSINLLLLIMLRFHHLADRQRQRREVIKNKNSNDFVPLKLIY
jgi:hypothetical protein